LSWVNVKPGGEKSSIGRDRPAWRVTCNMVTPGQGNDLHSSYRIYAPVLGASLGS
jgi:hypothetical protein